MTQDLTELRAKIDVLDMQIHDLLIERSRVVVNIAEIKAKEEPETPENAISHIRPQREMDIMRTMLNRHDGPLSPMVIARIWREIISAMAQLQGQFTVCIAAPTKSVGYWDLARDYFGSGTPMYLTTSPMEALRQVMSGAAHFAVLPSVNWRDQSPWWPFLLSNTGQGLNVVARLPVIANETAMDTLSSVVLAPSQHIPQNPDVHYVSIASDSRQSPHDLIEAFKAAGLSGNLVSIGRNPGAGPHWVHLMEITGELSDDALQTVLDNNPNTLHETRRLGGYLFRPAIIPTGS